VKGSALPPGRPLRRVMYGFVMVHELTTPSPLRRSNLPTYIGTVINRLSKGVGLGSGTVAGGRVALAIDPLLIERLVKDLPTVLISATNGKTTTTRMIATAVEAWLTHMNTRSSFVPGERIYAAEDSLPRVITNSGGANMPAGIASALFGAGRWPEGSIGVFEVDEGYFSSVAASTNPVVVVLGNLSRDQLDRINEVRSLANRWRQCIQVLSRNDLLTVVANADDPLVVWASEPAKRVKWVAAGLAWHFDAVSCPRCGGIIHFDDQGWRCACGFSRPSLVGSDALTISSDEDPFDINHLSLPGRCNVYNARLAVAAAEALGVEVSVAARAVASVNEVAGRYAVIERGGLRARFLLAKNPAGFIEVLEILGESRRDAAAGKAVEAPQSLEGETSSGSNHATDEDSFIETPRLFESGGGTPVVIAINARIADGRDTSWIWDVPFEDLSGRMVIASGERCLDLAVRLKHAGVEHLCVPDPWQAIDVATQLCRDEFPYAVVDFVGNYTAFQQARRMARSPGHLFGSLRSLMHLIRDSSQTKRSLSRWSPREGSRPLESPHRGGSDRWGERSDPTSPSARGELLFQERDRGSNSRGRGRRGGAVSIVVVYPDLLGTYGDIGNALILVNRLAWRGIPAEVLQITSDAQLPDSGDIYCIGGGDDAPQTEAALLFSKSGALTRAVEGRQAVVLAVCAGYQILGSSFPDADGKARAGIGLLDVVTTKGSGKRAVGELLSSSQLLTNVQNDLGGKEGSSVTLTGFENHAGVTVLGRDVLPLGWVQSGVGNGSGDDTEGAVSGGVVGTYMHGPVLSRNPLLADWILSKVVGALPPLDDAEEVALMQERLQAVKYGHHTQSGHIFHHLARSANRLSWPVWHG